MGSNVFNVMVVAEDGTVKQYGIIVQRQAQVVETPAESDSDSAVIIMPITPSDIELPPDNSVAEVITPTDAELDALFSTVMQEESADGDSTFKIIGIFFAVLALFFFGFLSGYYIDKANKKREEENRIVRELAYGGQNGGNDMQSIADSYDNPFESLYETSYENSYENQYENQYGMNYGGTNSEYQNGFDDLNGYN